MHAERGGAQRHRLHHVSGNGTDVLAGEPAENDGLVDAVEKFRTECLFELGGHRLADLGIAPLRRAVQPGEAERRAAVCDGARADVRGHHDHGVAEIDRPSLRIGEPPVVHDLQQQIEHVLMRLFDLVEENDAVGLTAHLFGELAALVKADVARRRADELGNRVLFHILGHIDADHGVFVAEHRLGERAAELRFADARGTEEQEAPDRAVRILEPDSAAPDGARHRRDGFVLPDHAAVEHILHVQQPLALTLGKARNRNARPPGNDCGNILGGYGAAAAAAPGVPFAARLFKRPPLGALTVAQLRGKLIVLRADGLLFLRGER